jgi:hypothetical protein
MRMNLLCDAHWESKVDKVLSDLSTAGYRDLFQARDYGPGLKGITVVFMCREPSLNFKQRIRFEKSEKKLYVDIMLDLNEMRASQPDDRMKTIINKLGEEIPSILRKRSIAGFDEPRFVEDLRNWIQTLNPVGNQ